jgi:ethanolamine utilization microcompartment shell protein EutS
MFRKSWHVHVAREVSLPASAIGCPVLTPGEYVMREVDLSAYDIAAGAMRVRLGFSHIFRMQRSGVIRIDGVFP